jgi:hypothetical protein
MGSVIASVAIREHADINATPLLACEGKCRGLITPHEFCSLELRYAYHPEDPPSLHLIYRCDGCNGPRRWGLITWSSAVSMDPDLLQNLSG